MKLFSVRAARTALLMAAVLLTGACSTALNRAPIIERLPTTVLEESPRAQVSAQAAKEAPVVVPPGYYAVKKGDTLIGIGLDTGNDWRELAVWNNLENPNRILVGQLLRVVPPATEVNSVAEVRPVSAPVEIRPVVDPTQRKSGEATGQSAVAAGGVVAMVNGAPVLPVSPKPGLTEKANDKPQDKTAEKAADKSSDKATDKVTDRASDKPAEGAALPWSWPANGQIIENFVEGRNKGIDIALKAGDPVLSALDGQVVYAGNALRGYGNLLIIKHPPGYLTAYAHNRKLLVKEGDTVKRAQQIAEAGNTDAERVKLHFEIRKGGKPVDPVKYLPGR